MTAFESNQKSIGKAEKNGRVEGKLPRGLKQSVPSFTKERSRSSFLKAPPKTGIFHLKETQSYLNRPSGLFFYPHFFYLINKLI